METWHWLPFVATLVTVGFAAAVFRRYAERRRPQLLWWGLGLALFALGTFTEAYLALGWSAAL